MKRVIITIIMGTIIALVIFYIILEIVVWNKVPSYLTNSQWISFLSTYFGNITGGTIALLGIGWQIKHSEELRLTRENQKEEEKLEAEENEKRKRKERVKKYILFEINRNLELDNFEKMIIWTQVLIGYQNTYIIPKGFSNSLYEFKAKFLDDNMDTILSLENSLGKDIISLDDKLKRYNKNNSLMENLTSKKKILIKKLKDKCTKEDHKYYNLMLEIIICFSEIIQGYSYVDNYKKLVGYIDYSNLVEDPSNKELLSKSSYKILEEVLIEINENTNEKINEEENDKKQIKKSRLKKHISLCTAFLKFFKIEISNYLLEEVYEIESENIESKKEELEDWRKLLELTVT